MRNYGRAAVLDIVKRACKKFMENPSAPDTLSFLYKGHYVNCVFEWSPLVCSYYLSYFDVVYSRSTVRYKVNEAYDRSFAWCC